MTDQPTSDQQPPTDHATMLPLKDAADVLGISVNAVRQRLKRGTLSGIKTDDGWLVDPSPATTSPTTVQPQPTNHPTIDLAPLTDLIAQQQEDIRRLTEATTVWQLRAMQAEDQLKQLSAEVSRARDEAPKNPNNAPESPETTETLKHESGYRHDPDRGSGSLWSRLIRAFRP